MSGFSYSKWDNLDCSSSEDEDEGDASSPSVTRLDSPSQVTFGGGAANATATPSPSSASSSASSSAAPSSAIPELSSKLSKIDFVPPSPARSSPATTNGGSFSHSPSPPDPSSPPATLIWSQTRSTVSISTPLPPSTLASALSVAISNAHPFSSRHSAVGTPSPAVLTATLNSTNPLFSLPLPHPVFTGDEEDEDAALDWEIETFQTSRFLTVTLNKAVPMVGVVVWWPTCVVSGAEIDVSAIQARAGGKKNAATGLTMKETWDEAHKLFKEKVKGREKQEVEVPDGDDDGKPAFPTLA
ncbi:hypothetical protein TeGR_g6439 [Tetraparma gracilis]|uniref:CS domain-containing protein n=1 Tax=Tetraparma gracilis TaxID=2962635 RepID=A0ABQ6N6G4_9STRA|nr:hypothetical protein TeGR_g6439 [Tetraparma gracilis]